MKKVLLIILSLLISGCTTKKETYEEQTDIDYIEIEEPLYNQDEPLSNCTIEVAIDLDGACLIRLINDSSNCYKSIHYQMSDHKGEFTNVASNCEVYDWIEGVPSEIEIIDYELSDHLLLNAADSINLIQFYRNDIQSFGYYRYTPIKDYHMKAKYIVLYNHHYISETLPVEIPSYKEDVEVEDTYVYWLMENEKVKIFNPNEYLTYHFGQVELFPRYYILERDQS